MASCYYCVDDDAVWHFLTRNISHYCSKVTVDVNVKTNGLTVAAGYAHDVTEIPMKSLLECPPISSEIVAPFSIAFRSILKCMNSKRDE
jgi:hypothetical protein